MEGMTMYNPPLDCMNLSISPVVWFDSFSSHTSRVLSTLNYFESSWKGQTIIDGCKWWRMSFKELSEKVRVSISHLARIIKLLVRAGIVSVAKLAENKSDRTNYYHLNKDKMNHFVEKTEFLSFDESDFDLSEIVEKVCEIQEEDSISHNEKMIKTGSYEAISLADSLASLLDNIKPADGNAVEQLPATYTFYSTNEPTYPDQTENSHQPDKEKGGKDNNGSVNSVTQAIELADRCVSDDPIFEKISDGLREQQKAVALVIAPLTKDETYLQAVGIWNELIGTRKQGAFVSDYRGVMLYQALEEYFATHTLPQFRAYCLRIARSKNLMETKFDLVMLYTIRATFLRKVEMKVVTMAPLIASDLPPEAAQLNWDKYTPADIILRFYVALTHGNPIYKSWFESLSFSKGILSGYSNNFTKTWIESHYPGTVIRVNDIYQILKKKL
jgi:DNA-binding transcriptional regulator GbsR (MarR family)